MNQIPIHKHFRQEVDSNFVKGDAIDILPTIPARYADHCITDPPYNISGYDGKKEIGWLKSNKHWTESKKFFKIDEDWDKFCDGDYEKFTLQWLGEIIRIVKPNGNIIVFGSYHNIYKIGYLLQKLQRKIINSVIWYKRNAFPNITQRMFCESTEHIIWAVNNDSKNAKNWVFNYNVMKNINVKSCKNCKVELNYEYRFCPFCSKNDFEISKLQMRNMWDIPSTPKKEKAFGGHPSQKPISVVKRFVLGCTNEKDIIIDPFAGSGTIPLVAKLNGRQFIAIERDNSYCNAAIKRLNASEPERTLL